MTDPCVAADQISDIKVDIGIIKTNLTNLNVTVSEAFSRFQIRVDDHEVRLRTVERITEAFGQIEDIRAEVESLRQEVATLKTSETVRSWWDNKKDLIIPGLIIAGITYLAGIITVRGL